MRGLQPHPPDDAEGHRVLGAQRVVNGKKDGAAGGAAQFGPHFAGEGVQQLAQNLETVERLSALPQEVQAQCDQVWKGLSQDRFPYFY